MQPEPANAVRTEPESSSLIGVPLEQANNMRHIGHPVLLSIAVAAALAVALVKPWS